MSGVPARRRTLPNMSASATELQHDAEQPNPRVTRLAPGALGAILSIWAHPDDETYLAGGTMAAARDRGQRVVCASATAGERGTSDPEAWPPERLGCVRRLEAAAAMSVHGVAEHHIAGFADGSLADREPAGLAWAGRLLDDVAADTILTFGPDGITFHPDHVAVHRWVTAAWRRRGCRERLLYAAWSAEHLARFGDDYARLGVFMTDARPTGVAARDLDLDVRLSGHELDRKLAALRAMATQTADLIAAVGPARYATQVAEEWFVTATR